MNNRIKLFSLSALALATAGGVCPAHATVIVDFEEANTGYTPSTTSGTSGSTIDIFNRTQIIPAGFGGNTTYFWAVEDLPVTDPSITLSTIDISGKTSFTFSIDMLTPNTEDWDTADEMKITYSVDSGAPTNLMWVQSVPDGDAFNAPAALDTDFDGNGESAHYLPAIKDDANAGVGSTFETFSTSSIALAGSGTQLTISIQFTGLDATAEGIYLDNISVTAVPEPSAYAALLGALAIGFVAVRRRRR